MHALRGGRRRRVSVGAAWQGITTFCALTVACWCHPHPDTKPEELIPWYFFCPMIALIFFNGRALPSAPDPPRRESARTVVTPWSLPWCAAGAAEYYAQRVIGNYYIRKAQDYAKRGVTKVDLHNS